VRHPLVALVAAVTLAMVAGVDAAKIKVKAEPDPNFDFAMVKTYAWDAEAGRVVMARTPSDDPAPLKARVEPLIRQFVEQEMTKKGKTVAAAGTTPDVLFHYYVLVTIDTNSQYIGQFLPSTPYWGLPPFDAGTSSLEVVTKGSLVLDALLPGAAADQRPVVWRGVAQTTVEDTDKAAVREARMREAIQELIKRFPLQKKK
jgi:hypothetical protein